MNFKSVIFPIFALVALIVAAFFVLFFYRQMALRELPGSDLNFATSTLRGLPQFPPEKISTSTKTGTPEAAAQKPVLETKPIPPPEPIIAEVSPKSFEELINSSVVQVYCGNLNQDETSYTDISRGTAVFISRQGELLTNRHIIYDENSKKIRPDCFIFKSPFPNVKSEKPKIYYKAEILKYPQTEKFSGKFSEDKYYNDFAILKAVARPSADSKIDDLLQTEFASEADYAVLSPYGGSPEGRENGGVFNYLPFDWNYRPKENDYLITLGYGIDASHIASNITSTVGKLEGNINVSGNLETQILLIESNATQGFSGGALINPKSKGLIGLISWITTGENSKKFTVAIFRDFLKAMMISDLNFDLKAL